MSLNRESNMYKQIVNAVGSSVLGNRLTTKVGVRLALFNMNYILGIDQIRNGYDPYFDGILMKAWLIKRTGSEYPGKLEIENKKFT